jgi:hypothetical protein
MTFSHGAVAQLGEHQAGSLGVVGSIPTSSTIKKLVISCFKGIAGFLIFR